MSDNVVRLGIATFAEIPPDRVLEKAAGQVTTAVVLGWDADGELYLSSSTADAKTILFLLELGREAVVRKVTR